MDVFDSDQIIYNEQSVNIQEFPDNGDSVYDEKKDIEKLVEKHQMKVKLMDVVKGHYTGNGICKVADADECCCKYIMTFIDIFIILLINYIYL